MHKGWSGAASRRRERARRILRRSAMNNTTLRLRTLAAAIAMAGCTAVAVGPAHAEPVPIVTGVHWTQSSDQVKKAYLIGIANVLQIESVYQGGNPPTEAQTLVQTAAKGLRGETLDGVRQTVDRWYAQNPSQLSRPVFEVIWFEVVIPGYAKKG
jgi:hypothetical protein